MSISNISEKTRLCLWGKAGGRCQYNGCNKPLWLDSLTKNEFNIAYIAHIIADKPGGPRGDPVLSEQLKDDISNLMLMCDEHHRLIDRKDVAGHPPEKLREMKKRHEDRIDLVTSMSEGQKSHVIFYGSNIGEQNGHITWEKALYAMAPNWFPAETRPIELSLSNSSFKDHEAQFWQIEKEHLKRQFERKISSRLSLNPAQHFSIFALAPQPLLIKLGHLLSDIPAAEVYQLHREPPNWKWQTGLDDFEYIIQEPQELHSKTALNLSLSATINESRITDVLGKDCSIWRMTIPKPNNDFLKGPQQLSLFRKEFRRLLDRIKAKQGQKAVIHIFPAVPVSVAVEIGRVRMPKADLPYFIYDENRKIGGFSLALSIDIN